MNYHNLNYIIINQDLLKLLRNQTKPNHQDNPTNQTEESGPLMTVSTASIPVLHSREVAQLYPQVVSYASCSSHFLR
jgi:hypothetical protein